MYSRWYNVAVVLLWLLAMGWLVIEKVMPPLRIGNPPSYQTILRSQKLQPLVGWQMILNGQPLGWALSRTTRTDDNLTEIHSRVHFNEIPLEKLVPGWLSGVVDRRDSRLEMDARNTLTFDPLQRLSVFRSALRFDTLEDAIKLQGTVDGNHLRVVVGTGGLTYTTEAYLPPDALLGDALSPQTQLPNLRPGQAWTVPVYNPLRPPNSPLEILQASVEGSEAVSWDGRQEETWLVVYRSDDGFRADGDKPPRGRLWVRRDGTVLKQQVMVFSSTMIFIRLADDRAKELAERVGNKWLEIGR